MRHLLIACSFGAAVAVAAEVAVVPIPAAVESRQGEFFVTEATPVVAVVGHQDARRTAVVIGGFIARAWGPRLRMHSGVARDRAINFEIDRRGGLAPEAYRLEITPRRVTVSAATAAGLFYGGTTLWQLMRPRGEGRLAIGAAVIADEPRFAWRGIMLDSARHYQSPEFIRRFIDAMAMHKLNVLHWHLTDDQAWRLEIRKYPRLTSVGAWRVPAGSAPHADIDPATGKARLQGGYYTQETVRALVAYAAERAITIVPEIEMPGHATAAIAAYPRLGAGAAPAAVPADWGIYPNVFNLEESTFNFIEDVFTEVLTLFPGRYIHKGGDEVQRDQWKDSPRTQARMRELGIADPAQLQAYFTTRIARFLAARGRRLVGWDEILEPELPRTAVVMSWRGIDGAIAAANGGYDTVLAPDPDLYFDNWQSREPDEPSGRMKALVSLESVYRFDPMPGKVPGDRRHHVLGLQGNVWTEHIRTEERVAWMTFPRAAAVAEAGWSAPERRDWPGFLRRLAAGFGHYAALGIMPADSAFAVHGHARYRADHAEVELSTPAGFGEIHYTVDGSPPLAASPSYAGPLSVAVPGEVRAASFDGERRLSLMRAFPIRREASQRRSSRELELCTRNIPLAVEDDAPLKGPRASFGVDIMNPCWIYRDADLDAVKGLVAAVGQVPFNYQIGEDVRKIVLAHPQTPAGELEVHLGKCDGDLLARLPLAPASASDAVTVLARAALRPPRGKHDLCLRFAQHGLDPLWVIDWVQLVDEAP